MQLHNEKTGSPEWLRLRREFRTASEAPAMMGASPVCTRNELLKLTATGTDKEFSNFVQKKILDKGHESEALARPFVVKVIDEDLYQVIGSISIDGLKLLASFDGLTIADNIVFEHKLWNPAKAEKMKLACALLPEYYWQVEQQLLVSGAGECIFVMSDGTKNNWLEIWYASVPERREALILGWKQFEKDVKDFELPEVEVIQAEPIENLPTLLIQLNGEVISSNLAVYQATALKFIEDIKIDLKTDEDFINAEAMVKFCHKAEKELKETKKHALAQTLSIDEMFKTVDFLTNELRKKRLFINKLVKQKKEDLKTNIVFKAHTDLGEYISLLNESLYIVKMPVIIGDFDGVIKNKRILSSIQNAVDTELAQCKIEADKTAEVIRKNLEYYESNKEYLSLLRDLQSLALKPCEDFKANIDVYVSNFKKQQEEVRIKAEKEAERKAEQVRIEAEKKAEKVKFDAEQLIIRKEKEAQAELERVKKQAESDKLSAVRQAELKAEHEAHELFEAERLKHEEAESKAPIPIISPDRQVECEPSYNELAANLKAKQANIGHKSGKKELIKWFETRCGFTTEYTEKLLVEIENHEAPFLSVDYL